MAGKVLLLGGRRILGCSRCAPQSESIHHFRGTHATVVDLAHWTRKQLKSAWSRWLGDRDPYDVAEAMRTCPECEVRLTEEDWLWLSMYCVECNSEIKDRDFCVYCGAGMAPGLFEELVGKGLHPIMVS